jgi:hypothetical protein
MNKHQIVRVEKALITKVKNAYPGFSFNKALRMVLLSADIIDVGDLDNQILAECKIYIDKRLMPLHTRIQSLEEGK